MSYSYLSDSQKKAIDAILGGKNVFVSGSAGTGKSYLLNYLKTELKNKNLQVTATTGIAAINIGGITLHSWANLGIDDSPVEQIVQKIFSASGINTRKKIQKTEILTIDEVSMLSMETFEKVDKLLRMVRNNDKPFGGIQMILFGDFFQLPPINSNNFCFESEVWQEAKIETIMLTEVFRQQDVRFIELLNNIRYGKITGDDIKLLKKRHNLKDDSILKPTILSTHNIFVEKINFEKLNSLTTKEMAYEAEFKGKKDKIEILRKNCMAKEILTLKIGSQVMMLKNTHQKDGIINGSTGIVIDFSSKKHYPVVEFENGVQLIVTPDIWEINIFNHNTGQPEVVASMMQVPLALAWAVTVHKSQGMTLDKAECDLQNSFADGQIYVALSRVRDLHGLFIRSFDINKIKINKKILKFYDSLPPTL
ncbi:MAG: AAA family ATPase, partial [Rickettsiales bacterium]|nr:AAA family ATPase [Rickettsiales bacterium]